MLNTCVNFSTNKTSMYSIVLNTFVHFKTIKNFLFQCVKHKFVHFNTIKKCLFQCAKHKFVHFNTIKNGLFQWVENMCLIWCNPRVFISAQNRDVHLFVLCLCDHHHRVYFSAKTTFVYVRATRKSVYFSGFSVLYT